MGFLTESMGSTGMLTSHRGTQPEIDLVGPGRGHRHLGPRGRRDPPDFGVTIQGAAFYEDRYVKVDGPWLIAPTGYKRTYEEIWPAGDASRGSRLSADWWVTGGRSDLI